MRSAICDGIIQIYSLFVIYKSIFNGIIRTDRCLPAHGWAFFLPPFHIRFDYIIIWTPPLLDIFIGDDCDGHGECTHACDNVPAHTWDVESVVIQNIIYFPLVLFHSRRFRVSHRAIEHEHGKTVTIKNANECECDGP